MRNGFGRKTLTASTNHGFGFGQFRNQKIAQENNFSDSEEQADDPIIPPVMEEKPKIVKEFKQSERKFKPKFNPLESLRNSFKQRNSREQMRSVARPFDAMQNTIRENIMTRNVNNLSDLKLISLKERRSITRGLKIQGLTKHAESDNLVMYVEEQEDVVIEKLEEISSNTVDKFHMFKVFSEIMSGILREIDEDDNLQLECIEECKRILLAKRNANKGNKPKTGIFKIREVFKKPISDNDKKL
jgi:hypothetical protein